MADPIGAVGGLPRLAPPQPLQGAGGGAAATPAGGATFADELARALAQVNALQLEADRQAELLATGELQDVHAVVLAAQKAELALQLTIQLRNRALEAYQEIIRMQV